MYSAVVAIASALRTTKRVLSRYVVSGYPGNEEMSGFGEVGVVGGDNVTGEGGLKTRSVMALRMEIYACWFLCKEW